MKKNWPENRKSHSLFLQLVNIKLRLVCWASLDLVKSRHYVHIYFNQSALHAFNQHNTFEMGRYKLNNQAKRNVCGNTHCVAKLTIDKTYWIKTRKKDENRRKMREEKKGLLYDYREMKRIEIMMSIIKFISSRRIFEKRSVINSVRPRKWWEFMPCYCACDLLWPINNRVRKSLEF